MSEGVAVPDGAQGRNLIKPCTPARIGGKRRVGSYRNIQDVAGAAKIFGDWNALRRRQFIVGVERRRVAAGAGLLLEDAPAPRLFIERIRIGRWFEGVDV